MLQEIITQHSEQEIEASFQTIGYVKRTNEDEVSIEIAKSIKSVIQSRMKFIQFDDVRSKVASLLATCLACTNPKTVSKSNFCATMGISRFSRIVSKVFEHVKPWRGGVVEGEDSSETLHLNLNQLNATELQAQLLLPVLNMQSIRSDKLDQITINQAAQFWSENCPVSPNANDICTRRFNGKVVEVHCKHYQYETEVELRQKFIQSTGIHIGTKNFSLSKPWYIREGKMSTCLCVYCEDFRLAKLCISRYREVLYRPYKPYFVARAFCAFHKAVVNYYKQRRGGNMPTKVNPFFHSIKAQFLWLVANCRVYNVVSLCNTSHKSEIARRLMCPNAIPRMGEDEASLRGKPECYGDCANTKMCLRCKQIKNIFRSKQLEDNTWYEEQDIVKYSVRQIGFWRVRIIRLRSVSGKISLLFY